MAECDRLDYIFWHPKFDEIIHLLSSVKFDVEELSSDRVIRSPIISGKTPEDYVYPMRGIPFIGAHNVQNNKIDLTECSHIDLDIHMRHNSSKVTYGDVLMTMAGAIGRCAVYTESAEANINQAVARLQPNTTNMNPHFLSYYLNSRCAQIQFERNRHDVNQPNINTTEIGYTKVVLPEKDVQDTIVQQLKKQENAIDNDMMQLARLTYDLRDIIPSQLHLSLPLSLTDYYSVFPDATDDRLDFVWNAPSTAIIKNYFSAKGAIKLGAIIDKNNDFEYGINAYGKERGKIPFVNIENLDLDGRIHREGIRYLDEASDDKHLKEGDLLISRSRTVGTCSLVRNEERDFAFGSYILRFRITGNEQINALYLTNYINSELGQAQITYLQTGARGTERGGGNNINPTNLRELLIVVPKNRSDLNNISATIQKKLEEKEELSVRYKQKLEEYTGAFERTIRAY